MDLRLEGYDWSTLSSLGDPDESVEPLNQKLWEMYNEFFSIDYSQDILEGHALHVTTGEAPLICKIRNKNVKTDGDVKRATRQGKNQ